MKPKKKNKHQRAKLVAVPLLVCLLGYVLFSPKESDDEIAAGILPAAQPGQYLSPQPHPPATAGSSRRWPEVDLQFLSQANPFASKPPTADKSVPKEHFVSATGKTAPAPLPVVDSLQSLAHDLSGSQVNYVFKSTRRQAVMLGDQMFERGEQLSDTVRLHEIQGHALILKEASNAPQFSWSTQDITELVSKFSQALREKAASQSPEVEAISEEPLGGPPTGVRVID